MKRLTRDRLFRNHGDLSTLPSEPPLRVAQGEEFAIETTDTGNMLMMSENDMDKPNGPMAGNPSTGPVYVEGVRAGEVIAVRIHSLAVVGHTKISIGDESLLAREDIVARHDFVRIEGGVAHFRGGLSVPVRPMYGCFGVVPAAPSPEPWHHGGNLDLPDICAGSTVHIRSERDGAWFCCGDGHAVQGDGEVNGYSLEVSLDGTLCIQRSPYQDLETILIENDSEFVTVGVAHDFADSIRSAERSMAAFLAARRGLGLLDAYQFASHVGSVRVGPIWAAVRSGQWNGGIPIPACVHLAKEHFGAALRRAGRSCG